MNQVAVFSDERFLLPRWRTLSRSTHELASANSISREPLHFASLHEAESAFVSSPGPFTAGDLIGQSLISGQTGPEVERARTLLNELDEPWLTAARRAMRSRPKVLVTPPSDDRSHWSGRVRTNRSLLVYEPRNAIRWVDLALAHLNLGNIEESRKSLVVASALAPDNRYVLRSISRFATVVDEPAFARQKIARSDSQRDPWVLAADLALADVAGTHPRHLRLARSLASSNSIDPRHLSELRATLATMELRAGETKRATGLMRLALEMPTENALAQAEWARQRGVRTQKDQVVVTGPAPYEAESRGLVASGAFDEALGIAQEWLRDQPFAPEPAQFISWLAISGTQRPEIAADAARRGLVANPEDWGLRNNLTVALAFQGDTPAAREEFSRIDVNSVPDSRRGTLIATSGLLAFRSGQPDEGRRYYLDAISLYERRQERDLAAYAALHWAHEEILAQTPFAQTAWARAEDLGSRSSDVTVRHWQDVVAEVRQHGSTHQGTDANPNLPSV